MNPFPECSTSITRHASCSPRPARLATRSARSASDGPSSSASELKFATDAEMRFIGYLRRHREVSDVLFTGGDPMVMKAKLLARYLEPLLEPGFEHIRTIRLGTKMLAYWPYRVLSVEDSD